MIPLLTFNIHFQILTGINGIYFGKLETKCCYNLASLLNFFANIIHTDVKYDKKITKIDLRFLGNKGNNKNLKSKDFNA